MARVAVHASSRVLKVRAKSKYAVAGLEWRRVLPLPCVLIMAVQARSVARPARSPARVRHAISLARERNYSS